MGRSRLVVSSVAIVGLLATSGAWLAPVAHAQWVDAGGMANQKHQHDLMRDQTSRDPPNDGDASRAPSPARAADRTQEIDEAAMKAEIEQMIERRRRELLPEYERRVRSDGRASADRWLREAASEAGRRDGAAIRAKYGQ